MSEFKRVAFIGLGQMGLPMATHLLHGGFQVVGFDLSEEARSAFRVAGGLIADSIPEALAGTDCIVTMLPNGKIVQAALVTAGAYKSAPHGALLLEMSSSAPTETRELKGLLGDRIRIVDAPVSGGVKRAVSGTLTVMAGGDAADVEQAEPLLLAMASKVFRCGPVGAGHAMKAINNYVSGAGVIAASEGVQLGLAFGLEAETVVDVLNASSGRNNATEVKMKQFILNGTFASGFALGLMAKDIRIAATLSAALGLQQDNLKLTADLWDDASKSIGGAADHTRLYEYLTKHGDGEH